MKITIIKALTVSIAVFGLKITSATPTDQLAVQGVVEEGQQTATDMNKEKSEKNAAVKVTITEVSMNYVKENFLAKKVTVVDALKEGDMIKGAIRIPADADDKTIAAKLKDKKSEIICYCYGPSCDAGMTLAERLVGLGYTNVKHYAGGISEWKQNNLPVTAEKK